MSMKLSFDRNYGFDSSKQFLNELLDLFDKHGITHMESSPNLPGVAFYDHTGSAVVECHRIARGEVEECRMFNQSIAYRRQRRSFHPAGANPRSTAVTLHVRGCGPQPFPTLDAALQEASVQKATGFIALADGSTIRLRNGKRPGAEPNTWVPCYFSSKAV